MNRYEVTIGIPVYRAVDYIEATMRSVLLQTYADIEFLIVDDCGGDGSMEIVERLQREHPRGNDIRILRNSETLGVGKSRNRLLDEAQGRYLYFLDSDDTIEPDTIELLYDAMKENGAEVVYGSYEKIDNVKFGPKQTFQYPLLCLLRKDEFADYAFSHYGSFQCSVCNCLFRLDFLRQTNLRFLDAMFWEDMTFTYDMVTQVSRAVMLPQITYHYLCRPNSLSNYQDRTVLHREEILNNASTIDYLKSKCYKLRDKSYADNLCYSLQMNSFYIVCHVLKHRQRISPPILNRELRQIMRHPMPFRNLMKLSRKRLQNMTLWLIAHLPTFLFMPIVTTMGKIKKVL
jgi:glycosyltransferase involved in cell wall biosynthesis